jgi:hypothetical protein
MDHYHRQGIIQRHGKQKWFSTKSPLSMVAVTIFTGLIVLIMPSAPVLVFAANIDGTSGDDILNGTDEADTINGFEGNDKLFGEGGDDTLDGGNGDDEIYGGEEADYIEVVSNAYIEGGPDDDIIYCTGINEFPIDGGAGDDEIHAEYE